MSKDKNMQFPAGKCFGYNRSLIQMDVQDFFFFALLDFVDVWSRMVKVICIAKNDSGGGSAVWRG